MACEFGYIDLKELFSHNTGKINFNLIDAGMVRPINQEYDFKDKEETIVVTPKGVRNPIPIEIPSKIVLDHRMVLFFGLYDGDGNKTNQIGFAQNEVHLQNFVKEMLDKLFQNYFKEELTILEDSRYFESTELKNRIEKFLKENQGDENALRTVQEDILREEYEQRFGKLPDCKIRYVISPLKGARRSGQSSYELIRNLKGSKPFLPFFLFLIKEVIRSIIENKKNLPSGVHWNHRPVGDFGLFIDAEKAVKDVVYANAKGNSCYYEVKKAEDKLILKKSRGTEFEVYSKPLVNPLLSLMFGFYLAEGTTTKAKFFTFAETKENLTIGFNSSEAEVLNIFLAGLKVLFPNLHNVFEYWLVKIGTKYFPEINAFSLKTLCPIARGGKKGQGISRSIEASEAMLNWAIDTFPIMLKYKDLFRHIEFTGSGIARVDLRCKSSSAPLLFSLMRDSINKNKFEECVVFNE